MAKAEGGAPAEWAAQIPRATYRLQLHRGFGFDAARRTLPYLRRLGISHVYCSPILRARSGSAHGYDVVAHGEINPELGGRAGFERFAVTLRGLGMGLLLDVVPNHMGVFSEGNPWWMDVLEHGEASLHAGYFDIDWHPGDPDLDGRLLLPVLGTPYGQALDHGELRLAFDPPAGSLALHYHAHRFPLTPRSYGAVLEPAARQAENAALADLAHAFGRSDAGDTAHALRLKRRLAALGGAHRAIEAAVQALNAPDQRDALHALHERQVYRLAHWRLAADDVNYRRFFDINDLAALRMELPEVFEATHGLLLDLAAAGQVDGLRIDHPDGLKDPAQYFERLQQGYARRAGLPADAAGGRPLYVVAEKIAAPHEDVPTGWALHGTTGYRFAMVANGVLVDADAADAFERVWQWFVADDTPFGEHVVQARREAACRTLASELDRLAMALLRIARSDRHTRDHSLNSLHEALAGIASCMPVYRTYVIDTPSAQDLHLIDWAVAQARRRSRLADLSVFDFVRACLCNQPCTPAAAEQVRDFAQRFQQFSAPVAAKGVEDTAFYRYHRLVSLNEVGGDPAVFGISPRAFHAASADRAARWPHTLIATSTHDNKRSEDVRNRINVLSEMPRAWDEWLGRWHAMSTSLRTEGAGAPMPSPADEYLLYQTLLGTLPAAGLDEAGLGPYRERIRRYMVKAAREAKQRTCWTRPDDAYEQALCNFVEGLLVRVRPNPLLSDLSHCARVVAGFGALNSLSTVLLKYTAPGVPDLYQGNELMDLSLVDPDNRRPVDHGLRERLLHELDDMEGAAGAGLPGRLAALVREPHDGRAKLWLTSRLLRLRAAHVEFFRTAGYAALEVSGARARHVLAYVRTAGDITMVVVVGRLFTGLVGDPLAGQVSWPVDAAVWEDTCVVLEGLLPEGTVLDNVVTGQRVGVKGRGVEVAEACSHWPGAVLLGRGGR